jgi:hypothetical protein
MLSQERDAFGDYYLGGGSVVETFPPPISTAMRSAITT